MGGKSGRRFNDRAQACPGDLLRESVVSHALLHRGLALRLHHLAPASPPPLRFPRPTLEDDLREPMADVPRRGNDPRTSRPARARFPLSDFASVAVYWKRRVPGPRPRAGTTKERRGRGNVARARTALAPPPRPRPAPLDHALGVPWTPKTRFVDPILPEAPRAAWPHAGIVFTETREALAHPEWLKRERVAPQWRDFCAHLLIPLNRCRQSTFWSPFKCEEERHAYERCEYVEYVEEGEGMGRKSRERRGSKGRAGREREGNEEEEGKKEGWPCSRGLATPDAQAPPRARAEAAGGGVRTEEATRRKTKGRKRGERVCRRVREISVTR